VRSTRNRLPNSNGSGTNVEDGERAKEEHKRCGDEPAGDFAARHAASAWAAVVARRRGTEEGWPRAFTGGFFIFLFSFFTKIYFRFRNLQKYTPAAPLPGGRAFMQKLLRKYLRAGLWRPALAARLPGGRLSQLY